MGRKLTNITPEARRELFLEQLRKEPNITKAAKAAGYARRYVYELRDGDPDFAEAWDDALQESLDLCEGELHRRAFKGTLKPVFYLGEKVGAIREYSDVLGMFLMKAHRPERYRETSRHELTGADGKPIQHEGVGLTDTERVAKLAAIFDAARDRRDGRSSSDSPDTTLQPD